MKRRALFEDARHDVRYALRAVRRTKVFSAVVVATLALGIGASTAIFTVVDAVLLRPLKFREPQRLAVLRLSSGSRISEAYLHDWRLQSRAFEDLAGWKDARSILTGPQGAEQIELDEATSNFFEVLGTPALIGRTFSTQRDLSRVEPEVVLSHGFWLRRYGARPEVVGQSLTLDGRAFTIVGVMPRGFAIRTNELAESRAEVWTPLALVRGNQPGMGGALNVVGRLAAGAAIDRAATDLALIAEHIERQYPSYSREWRVRAVPLHEATVTDVRLSLLVLFSAVSILLLVACANVANLFLHRAAARRPELAIRRALGASRARLVRQFLAESFVLVCVGGGLGMLVAVFGTKLLVSSLHAALALPRAHEIGLDSRGLVFALLVCASAGVLLGFLPAIGTARRGRNPEHPTSVRGATADGRSNRLRSILILSEIALATVLLAGAGLLVRTFWQLSSVDPGFRAGDVITMRTTLPAFKYDNDDRLRAYVAALVERMGGVAGVRGVGWTNYLPLTNVGVGAFFEIEGRPKPPAGSRPSSWINVVGGRYFEAMGIPLLRGRLPGPSDTERTRPVVVIDEQLWRRYWPSEDPIGARLAWERNGRSVSTDVVGVVGSVRWGAVAADPNPTVYFWFPQVPDRQVTLVARVANDPGSLAGALSRVARDLDPNQPIAELRPMRDFVSSELARPRFTMLLLTVFAASALALAAIGLYGVIEFSVTQRIREIAVRVALGAQRRDVRRLVMLQGALLTAGGLAIGLVSALALGRLVSGLLYGVASNDPATLLGSVLCLGAVAVLATYTPARRAMRVDPIVALKAE